MRKGNLESLQPLSLTLLELRVARLVINNPILRPIHPLLRVALGGFFQVLDVAFKVVVSVVVAAAIVYIVSGSVMMRIHVYFAVSIY